METLIIALGLTAAAVVAVAAVVVSGRLPRLAARAAYLVESLLDVRDRFTQLDPRERAELVARLWLPW